MGFEIGGSGTVLRVLVSANCALAFAFCCSAMENMKLAAVLIANIDFGFEEPVDG